MFNRKMRMPDAAAAPPGRDSPIPTAGNHYVSGNPLKGP
jgi:peptide-methionine (S)-S-oxide reductase